MDITSEPKPTNLGGQFSLIGHETLLQIKIIQYHQPVVRIKLQKPIGPSEENTILSTNSKDRGVEPVGPSEKNTMLPTSSKDRAAEHIGLSE